MVLLERADNALEVAYKLAQRTAEGLSETAQRIYTALVATGLEVAIERKYCPKVSEVSFFCPAESVALSVGIHPATLYRKLPELRAAGLVEVTGHYCTHNRQTRLDGSVWAVRLVPGRSSKVRIGFDWLKRSYRCLGADIEAGRTAWAMMRESKSTRDKSAINLNYIRFWTLSTTNKVPVKVDSRTIDLASIFDVPTVPKQSRAEKIFDAAKAISSVLNDNSSHRFYMAVLWNLTRLKDSHGVDYFAQLHMMVRRCQADVAEGFARAGNGGALLTSRLKKSPLWDEVAQT
jgi:hypothetical protein